MGEEGVTTRDSHLREVGWTLPLQQIGPPCTSQQVGLAIA